MDRTAIIADGRAYSYEELDAASKCVAGTLLATACRRWTRRPRPTFVILAVIGLVASFAMPVVSDASTATKVVLSISHLVVAAIIVPALALALPTARASASTEPC